MNHAPFDELSEHPGGWDGLLAIGRILRGPHGCPWDKAQTADALAGHLVEEAYEVLEASRGSSPEKLAEELGDALFLVALVQTVAEEAGGPDAATVAGLAAQKTIRRHPHVFGEEREQLDAREVAIRWERRKRAEREAAAASSGAQAAESGLGGNASDTSAAVSLPPPSSALPALLQAYRLQEKAAVHGFDWPDATPVIEKIDEELEELKEAIDAKNAAAKAPAAGAPDPADLHREGDVGDAERTRVQDELGDLLFAVVNLARKLEMDPELALRQATVKFRTRFNRMAELAEKEGACFESLDLAGMDAWWEAVKRDESRRASRGSDDR